MNRIDQVYTDISSTYSYPWLDKRLLVEQALEGLPGVMSDKRAKDVKSQEAKEDQLYRKIGQLEVELDWLKKKSGQLR